MPLSRTVHFWFYCPLNHCAPLIFLELSQFHHRNAITSPIFLCPLLGFLKNQGASLCIMRLYFQDFEVCNGIEEVAVLIRDKQIDENLRSFPIPIYDQFFFLFFFSLEKSELRYFGVFIAPLYLEDGYYVPRLGLGYFKFFLIKCLSRLELETSKPHMG